jgi:hypothetical protein
VRDVIHAFNAEALACLDLTGRAAVPAGSATLTSPSSPRRPLPVAQARAAVHVLEHPQTRRLPCRYGHTDPRWTPASRVRIGREWLRQIPPAGSRFSGPGPGRTPTTRPRHQAGPDRESHRAVPGPVFRVRPVRAIVDPPVSRHLPVREEAPGSAARPTNAPTAFATSTAATAWPRTGCGVSCTNTQRRLAALKSIRAARPDGAPIYVILDNLSANTTPAVRSWCSRHKVELCLTPANASWANPIVRHRGRMSTATLTEGGSTDVEGVVPGPVRNGPSPLWRASRVTAGCEAQGDRPKGRRSIRWQQAGEDRTGESREPSLTPRHCHSR